MNRSSMRALAAALAVAAIFWGANSMASVVVSDPPPVAKPGLSEKPFVEWSAGSQKILRKEVIVRAPVQALWHAWTTSEGIASFFVPDSNIDLRIGGPFELFMRMDQPDESGLRGSETCRILSYLENEMVAFEWNFPPTVMKLRKGGEKTHVVVRLTDLGDGRVKVTLSQVGWGKGADWDAGFDYFNKAWGMVLNMLKEHFEKEAKEDKKPGIFEKPELRTWDEKHVKITSYDSGNRRQDFELEIPASVEEVWNVLTTPAGLAKIGGKNSVVELMPGGKWEFWPGSPTRVQAYVPMEMLMVTGSAPPQFPEVQKGGHWGVYFLDPISSTRTKLRLCVVGWKKGDEWNQAFDYFLKNNPVFLEWIHDAFAYPVKVASTTDSLEMTCTVAAPRSEVWDAFTTEKGMTSWMVAQAKLDWCVGGKWQTKYSKEGHIGDENTIENIILSYEPQRMFSIKIGKPPANFPFTEAAKNTWTVIYFDDAPNGHTKVRVVGLGYGDDDESKRMREFFDRGNKWTLQRLQEKFAPKGTFVGDGDGDATSPDESKSAAVGSNAPSPELESYMAHVAAAGLSLERGETAEARRWLDSAPEVFRNWEWRYFDANLDESVRQWRDLGAGAMFAAVRPDGKQIAIATTDGRVLIRDAKNGSTVQTIRANDKALWHVAYDAEGKRVATASSDGTARIWNADTGEEVLTLTHEKSQVYSVAFSPDGKLVATSLLSYVKLWDADTGKELATLEGHVLRPPVIRVAFSPDGKKLASAGWDNWVIVWDVEKREALHKLGPGYGGEEYTPYNDVAFSPDGRQIVAASGSGKVWTWDAETGEVSRKWHAHDKTIYAVAWSPDARSIATGASDLSVRVWDGKSGELKRSGIGHSGMIRGVAFADDGQTLISAASDKSVRFWETGAESGPLTVRHTKGVWSTRFSADGSMLATAGSDHAVRVWNPGTGAAIAAFEDLPEQGISAAFSPCGRYLAGATNKPPAFIWDLEDKKLVHTLEGHTGGVPGLAFNREGTLLASASYDGTVRLWNPTSGELVRTLEGPGVSCVKAEFSPDGALLATAGTDGVVRLWNVSDGSHVAALEGHKSRLGCVAFDESGRLLASGGSDRTVRIWDVGTRKLLHEIFAHEDGIYGVSFTPDATRLATTSYDQTVKLWDVSSGRCAATIERTKEGGYDVAFSPDGKRLAVTFADGSVQILDTVSAAFRAAKADRVARR